MCSMDTYNSHIDGCGTHINLLHSCFIVIHDIIHQCACVCVCPKNMYNVIYLLVKNYKIRVLKVGTI